VKLHLSSAARTVVTFLRETSYSTSSPQAAKTKKIYTLLLKSYAMERSLTIIDVKLAK
jgi:hypothetical protein